MISNTQQAADQSEILFWQFLSRLENYASESVGEDDLVTRCLEGRPRDTVNLRKIWLAVNGYGGADSRIKIQAAIEATGLVDRAQMLKDIFDNLPASTRSLLQELDASDQYRK